MQDFLDMKADIQRWTEDKFQGVEKQIDSIDKKMDIVQQLQTQQAVTNERIVGFIERLAKTVEEQEKLQEELDLLRDRVERNAQTVDALHKVAWVFIAALITVIIKQWWPV